MCLCRSTATDMLVRKVGERSAMLKVDVETKIVTNAGETGVRIKPMECFIQESSDI